MATAFYSPLALVDSGYGGLSVLKSLRQSQPSLDVIYFGDNANAPYGNRPIVQIEALTYQAISTLFEYGCPCVFLACNTASTVLSNIKQQLSIEYPSHHLIDIITPTICEIQQLEIQRLGVLATAHTIKSEVYRIELPEIGVSQLPCPTWASLVEKDIAHTTYGLNEIRTCVERLLNKDSSIQTVLLACTHFPWLIDQISQFMPSDIEILTQGNLTAKAVSQWVTQNEKKVSYNGTCQFFTSGETGKFNATASQLLGYEVKSSQLKKIF